MVRRTVLDKRTHVQNSGHIQARSGPNQSRGWARSLPVIRLMEKEGLWVAHDVPAITDSLPKFSLSHWQNELQPYKTCQTITLNISVEQHGSLLFSTPPLSFPWVINQNEQAWLRALNDFQRYAWSGKNGENLMHLCCGDKISPSLSSPSLPEVWDGMEKLHCYLQQRNTMAELANTLRRVKMWGTSILCYTLGGYTTDIFMQTYMNSITPNNIAIMLCFR